MALIYRNVKNTIIMFQCEIYLNTTLVRIIMLVRLLVEVECFPLLWIEKEKNYILWY